MGADTFDPTAIAEFPKTHNQPPEPTYLAIFKQIDDLFDEAKNFADGEAITSQPLADAMTELHDKIHALGKQADELRIEEKKPLDDKVNEIQDRFNKYIQPKKGRVDLAKSALGTLLATWRTKLAADKAADAALVAAQAEAARVAATAAIQASSGNLAARADAEELLADAKKLERQAGRAWKAATTGTGLRSVWVATPATEPGSEEKRLDWAFNKDPERFAALVQEMADSVVNLGGREVPGFKVWEDKRATVGRV